MEFRLFGPVEVRAADRRIDTGEPRQRTVLAALLVDAGQVVSSEALIGRVWGDAAPAGARRALHAHVARVRRVLAAVADLVDGRMGTPTLVHGSGGYRLDLDPELVDLHRGRQLVVEARRADSDAVRVGLLEQVRALWYGEFLTGIPGEWAARMRSTIDRERLDAMLLWAHAKISLGEPAAVINPLTDLADENPFVESLTAALMRALHAAGRTADALDCYAAMRRRLADELGTDPGAELRDRHQAILRGEADPGVRPTAPTDSVPRQLPLGPTWLVGRGVEVARLEAALGAPGDAAAVVIASIGGTGGVGKSALAIHTAHRLAAAYPDGQLYADLQGATAGAAPLEPIDVLARFLRSLGVTSGPRPRHVDEAAALFRSRLADRRMLILLDNAVDESQVRPLLPGSPGCGVIITSRRTLSGLDGSHLIHLDVLEAVEAVDLLGRLIGERRVTAEPENAAALARWCGYLPLALRIAAARLAARPDRAVATLSDRLADEHRRLDELEHGDVGVRATFSVSYGQLRRSPDPTDRAAATAFVLLGAWNGPDLDEHAAMRLLGMPDQKLTVLDRLVDARLIDARHPGRYRLHDLLRLYARERAGEDLPEADHIAALRRVLSYYITTTWDTLSILRPGNERLANMDPQWLTDGRRLADPPGALVWLEEERINLLAAVEQAASTDGLEGAAIQLAQGLFGFLPVRGYWRKWQCVNEIALDAAMKIGDLAAEAQVLNDLAGSFYIQGNHAEAEPRILRGLALFRQLGNRRAEASLLGNLGLTYEWQGRVDDALRCAEQSRAIYLELGDRHGEANSTTNLGTLLVRRGRLDEALTWTTRALTMYQELGERVSQARCLNTIGEIYRSQNRLGEAIDHVNASLSINEEVGNRQGYADNLNVLGEILSLQGCHEEALTNFRRSVTIFRELGGRQDEAEALRRVGDTLVALGRRPEANEQFRAALAICEELGLPDADRLRDLIGGTAR